MIIGDNRAVRGDHRFDELRKLRDNLKREKELQKAEAEATK